MFELVVLLVVLSPPILAYCVRRTAGWWIPGIALVFGGLIPFGFLENAHGEEGAITAVGNGVLAIMGFGLVAYGLVLLAITYGARVALQRRQVRQPLPPATLLAGDVNTR